MIKTRAQLDEMLKNPNRQMWYIFDSTPKAWMSNKLRTRFIQYGLSRDDIFKNEFKKLPIMQSADTYKNGMIQAIDDGIFQLRGIADLCHMHNSAGTKPSQEIITKYYKEHRFANGQYIGEILQDKEFVLRIIDAGWNNNVTSVENTFYDALPKNLKLDIDILTKIVDKGTCLSQLYVDDNLKREFIEATEPIKQQNMKNVAKKFNYDDNIDINDDFSINCFLKFIDEQYEKTSNERFTLSIYDMPMSYFTDLRQAVDYLAKPRYLRYIPDVINNHEWRDNQSYERKLSLVRAVLMRIDSTDKNQYMWTRINYERLPYDIRCDIDLTKLFIIKTQMPSRYLYHGLLDNDSIAQYLAVHSDIENMPQRIKNRKDIISILISRINKDRTSMYQLESSTAWYDIDIIHQYLSMLVSTTYPYVEHANQTIIEKYLSKAKNEDDIISVLASDAVDPCCLIKYPKIVQKRKVLDFILRRYNIQVLNVILTEEQKTDEKILIQYLITNKDFNEGPYCMNSVWTLNGKQYTSDTFSKCNKTNDKEFMSKIIMAKPAAFPMLSERLQNDKEYLISLLKALKSESNEIQYGWLSEKEHQTISWKTWKAMVGI